MRTGLIAATGHYRHGVLAAPLTAQAVADLIEGAPVPEAWRPFIPGRFE
jgi:glycine oxidase